VKTFLYLVLVLTLGAATTGLQAGEKPAAEQLAEQLQSMDSLTARFNQSITDARGDQLQQAEGTLAVKRPRRFYWRTESPYEHLVVTDGILLWLYDIDLEQITKQPFSADLDRAPALLLSGELEEINKQYTIKLQRLGRDELQFTLLPNNADSLFRLLTISFGKHGLKAMTLKDSFDQLTEISFSDVKLNPRLKDKLFEFTPPEGIDVISNES